MEFTYLNFISTSGGRNWYLFIWCGTVESWHSESKAANGMFKYPNNTSSFSPGTVAHTLMFKYLWFSFSLKSVSSSKGMIGFSWTLFVQNIWHISTCSLCLGPPVSNICSSSSISVSVFSGLHSEESVLIIGMSGCFTILLITVACLRGVLAPDAGGVLPAELSEDLFSTEHLLFRKPKFPGPGSEDFVVCRVVSGFCLGSASFCGSGTLAGESLS